MVLQPGAAAFSVDLHAGEVVAITGLVGSGKAALAHVLFGLQSPDSGAVTLKGAPFRPRDQASAIRQGVFLCPRDRASNAVLPDFDIGANITLPFLRKYSWGAFRNRRKEQAVAQRVIDDLGIVCQHRSDDINSLSGGNQQKTIVGRWLAEPCGVLVLDEPFQGVDIKARRDIGLKIRETAPGRATLVMVAEMDEALEIADRILVMYDHTIVGDHRNERLDLNAALSQVAGRKNGQANQHTGANTCRQTHA